MNFVLDEGAFAPEYAHSTDAGMDIRSPVDALVPAWGNITIDTRLHIELLHNTVGMLKSKSGLNVKHCILNEGVIDEGFLGSIKVKLYNFSDTDYQVLRGDKISQLIVIPYVHCNLVQVDKLQESERGENGIGSTGR